MRILTLYKPIAEVRRSDAYLRHAKTGYGKRSAGSDDPGRGQSYPLKLVGPMPA